MPPGKAKATLENACTECHALERTTDKLQTKDQWRTTVVRMRRRGAAMTDEEVESLVDYLARNFGPAEGGAKAAHKLNINDATTHEMESELQLRFSDALAIYKYRRANGPFKTIEELTRLEGVDKAAIEAVKDRITF